MAKLSSKEKRVALLLYKAHYSASEAADLLPVGYGAVRTLWRGFETAEVSKKDRLTLLNHLERTFINNVIDPNSTVKYPSRDK